MGLTAKQARFAQLVALEGVSQSEAYRQAYDVSPHAAPKTVWDNASQLVRNTGVAQRIAELRAAAQERAVVTATEVLEKLKAIGFAPPDQGRIRPSDQVAALDKMAKILGLYRDGSDGDAAPRAITQITVILDRGAGGTSTETRRLVDPPRRTGRVLEPSDEAYSR